MINTGQKTSLLIPSQLPAFVRDNPDYENFVLFLQAYYEWMEENGGVTDGSKNILTYADIDTTTTEFMDYFINDFLPYFPKDALVNKTQAIKVARQLYQAKGTPSSFKFLFRTLYDSDFDLFYTKDAVLRASDGKWYVAKSLRLSTLDSNFLSITNLRLFGETTKSIATVENAIKAGTKTEVFISNIERLFQSGEFVRVVDSNNQDVLFDGQPLRAKVVGQINQINIDPIFRGLLYQPGDPVVVYGGLSSNTGIGAAATVDTITAGSIKRINVLTGGYGYTLSPNTTIQITNAGGAAAFVASVDPNPQKIANVAFIPSDVINLKSEIPIGNVNYFFSNIATSNANTRLQDAFTFDSLTTYPISSVLVTNGGGGITKLPTVSAISNYYNDLPDNVVNLKSLGILAPIQIINGGQGYQANDTIIFSGGSGDGAYANVTQVSANGAILKIEYVNGSGGKYPVGGQGYIADSLPVVTVNSANTLASNASVYVPGILGDGATFAPITDRAGSVTTIKISNYGEDYIEAPGVSLKVQDIIVQNIDIANQPKRGDVIYQGASIEESSYLAYVDSLKRVEANIDPTLSLYNLRVYNYNSNPDPNLYLKIKDKNIEITMSNFAYTPNYNANGIRNYGDGTAKATATFLNGLTISGGQYLNSQGQPSSFNKLQSTIYNNYTYEITVQKEISKYRNILLNLLHPTGMQLLGRYKMISGAKFNFNAISVE
jgi:hypothetical protein